jgi:hypothetical protein
LWCSSFQLAWNELKTTVVGEPVRIAGAEAECERLNRAPQSIADLPADCVYATAGFDRDGICETIRREMARRFPESAVPDLPVAVDGVTAFAHLKIAVKFEPRFDDLPRALQFTNNRGLTNDVAGFGTLPYPKAGRETEARDQVRVLFAGNYVGETPGEFALDVSKATQPSQIILAVLPRRGTLAESIADLERKTAEFDRNAFVENDFDPHALNAGECMQVPAMHWRIQHSFKELVGPDRLLLNGCCNDMFVTHARQQIEFRLDSGGAFGSSTAYAKAAAAWPKGTQRPHSQFLFNRPFLVCVKKRDARHPFLVMAIDNANLLIPKNPN